MAPAGRLLSIKYFELAGINYLRDVTGASADTRRAYVTRSGFENDWELDQNLVIAKGPFRGRTIEFGVGVQTMISRQHQISRAELIEAFETNRGAVPEDESRSLIARGTDPRKWFAARLADGRRIKIAYAIKKNGTLTIVSAHDIDERKYEVYLSLVRRFGAR
jgi:hypothetical protein